MKQLIIKEIEVMLNKTKKYYQDNKEVLREKAKNKYRELSDEQKTFNLNIDHKDHSIHLIHY